MSREVSETTRAHGAMAAVAVAWAGAFAAIKALLDHGIAAEDIAVLRYLVAAPGFAWLLWRAGGLPGIRLPDLARVCAAGLLIVMGYHLSLNVGERYATSGTAALIVALAPGLTLAFALVLGLERFLVRRAVALAVAFGGVAVVVLVGGGEELSLGSAKGPLIVLGAPLSFALYNVLLKPLFASYGLLPLTAATSLVGTVGLAALVRPRTAETLAALSARDVVLVLYLGVLCTLLGYLAWNVGLRALGASRAVAYAYCISPLGVVIGALTLDEPVTVWLALGGVLIVGGIALAQSSGERAAG